MATDRRIDDLGRPCFAGHIGHDGCDLICGQASDGLAQPHLVAIGGNHRGTSFDKSVHHDSSDSAGSAGDHHGLAGKIEADVHPALGLSRAIEAVSVQECTTRRFAWRVLGNPSASEPIHPSHVDNRWSWPDDAADAGRPRISDRRSYEARRKAWSFPSWIDGCGSGCWAPGAGRRWPIFQAGHGIREPSLSPSATSSRSSPKEAAAKFGIPHAATDYQRRRQPG